MASITRREREVATVVTQHAGTLQRASVALGAAGLDVRAHHGLDGLACDGAAEAALLMVDLDIAPDASVAELAELAQERCPGVPIVATGAQSGRARLMEALAQPGIDHLVPKRAVQGGPAHGPDEHSVFTAARRILGHTASPDLGGYLVRGAPLYHVTLTGSEQRPRSIARMADYLAALQVPEAKRIALELAAEELLMNALYDAPCDEVGAPRHAHLDRQRPVDLDPGEEVELSWGCDGQSFALAVSDPFGALQKRHVVGRLKLAVAGALAPMPGVAGAGLGVAMVHRVVNQLVFGITPRRRTEVIAVLRLAGSHRDNMEAGTAVHFHIAEAGGQP